MKICGVVLNYFGHEETITCVRALVDQKELNKIIIVENSASSTELTVLEGIFKDDRQVGILSPSQNLGFSGGVTFAINSVIDSPFDAFLIVNNDTLAPSNLVENLMKGVQAKSLDLAAPLIYHYPEKHLLWSRGNFYNPIFGIVRNSPIPCLPRNVFYLTGCCLFVRKKVFDTVGFFDESFFMYGEDVEFCHRAEKNRFRIGIVKEAKIYHRVNASSQNNSLFYEYHINRGHFILSKKLRHSKFEYMTVFSNKVCHISNASPCADNTLSEPECPTWLCYGCPRSQTYPGPLQSR